jgi:RNA polymerase sigma factor for flagellar operon FliA
MYEANDIAERQQWVEKYAPLVKRIAHHMMARLPASVELDDIVQAGMVGLLDAVARYEETQGAQFETYAVQRIRGAILDELRESDWLPRRTRKDMRRIEAAISALEQANGRAPGEKEIAEYLALPLDEYQHMLNEARGHQILYYEDFANPGNENFIERRSADDEVGVLDGLINEELRARVAKAVSDLPEREKLVMSLYYEKDLNLREIGAVLGVSESRVCQIHTQAVARLRTKIGAN